MKNLKEILKIIKETWEVYRDFQGYSEGFMYDSYRMYEDETIIFTYNTLVRGCSGTEESDPLKLGVTKEELECQYMKIEPKKIPLPHSIGENVKVKIEGKEYLIKISGYYKNNIGHWVYLGRIKENSRPTFFGLNQIIK